MMERDKATWNSVKKDTPRYIRPLEWLSRKIIFYYTELAFLRVLIAFAGAAAIFTAILDLMGRQQDSILRDLGLLVQIKSDASGKAVAALAKNLINRGVPASELPLSKANLENADLSEMDLQEVNLKETQAVNVKFVKSKLNDANFSKSLLSNANFEKALLNNAKFNNFSGASVNFKGANLTGAFLRGSFMWGAQLVDATLSGAMLEEANLAASRFTNAVATTAFLGRANLDGADLTNAKFVNAKFWGTKFGNAKLHQTEISGAEFEGYQNGEIWIINGTPMTAEITVEQLRQACASPDNPPKLPRGDKYKDVIVPPCR